MALSRQEACDMVESGSELFIEEGEEAGSR